jgi:hypothetical protein
MDQHVTKVFSPTSHVCPLSSIEILGECTIRRCPANLPSSRHASGCYYELMGIANEIDLPGLSFAFGISRRRVRKELDNGFIELQRLAILYEWLDLLRDNGDKYCSKCGMPGADCINIMRCNYRSNLIIKIKTMYPFNIPELKFTGNDLWLLLKNQDNLTKQYSFEHVFGFTSEQMITLHRTMQHR